jgi:hypothetical protein
MIYNKNLINFNKNNENVDEIVNKLVNASRESLGDHSFNEFSLLDGKGRVGQGLGREASHQLVITSKGTHHHVLMNVSYSVVKV